LDAKEDAKERHIVIRDTARHISDEWRDALTAYRELKQSPWWLQLQHFLYYSGRHLVPPPLRAFLDFIKATKADH
jgi:hypothetical protein